jgi:cysteinyl-tRNA synthetase
LYTALKDHDLSQAQPLIDSWVEQFQAAMNDDFNTPEAIAVLFGLSTEANKARQNNEMDLYQSLAHTLKHLAGYLGFLQRTTQAYLQSGQLELSESEIETFIEQRAIAKKNKDFATSDAIRQDLLAKGIVLEDQPQGKTTWRKN